MAISKTLPSFQTSHGIDIIHSVIDKIILNYKTGKLSILMAHYTDAADYNDGKIPIFRTDYTYATSSLPASVITNAVTIKNTVEDEMIIRVDDYLLGTRVNDDGTSL